MKTSLTNNLSSSSEKMSGEWRVLNPAQSDQVIGTCGFRYSDVDAIVSLSSASVLALSLLSAKQRWSLLKQAREILIQHQEEFIQLAMLELGRTREDLSQEWSQIERYLGAFFRDESIHLTGEARGVTAIIGSYVWPLFYSLQFVFSNFLVGNAVILKPSEKSTLTVHRVFEVLRAELKELSAVQVLVGDREIGRRLACHEGVSTVIFQGSFEVGMRVRQDTMSQPAKEVLLFLGAKNPAVVFDGADSACVKEILRDAFQGTGQDCQSVSIVLVEKSRLDSFLIELHEAAKSFKIGSPESGAWMGPLIDGAMLDRYLKFIGISEREGAEILMRGKLLPALGRGHFVTPTLAVFRSLSPEQMRKSVSLQTEILSPHLSVISFQGIDELKAIMEKMSHGSLCTLWGEGNQMRELARDIPFSKVVVNGSSLQFDPWVSTHSRKRSGNHGLLGVGLLAQLTRKRVIQG